MSAADKLRDLHALLDPVSDVRRSMADQVRSIDSLADALPDIIAVIAAAETYSRNEYPNPCLECQHTGCVQARALAALNARLTNTRDGGEA